MLNSIQHLTGKGFDETSVNLFSTNLDRMNRYAMISPIFSVHSKELSLSTSPNAFGFPLADGQAALEEN